MNAHQRRTLRRSGTRECEVLTRGWAKTTTVRIDASAYKAWKETLPVVQLDNGTSARLYSEHPTRMVTFSGLT